MTSSGNGGRAGALAVLIATLTAGCNGSASELYPLSDVPIIGGNEEQRSAARTELLAFDEAVGVGRVLLRSVRFRPYEEDVLGSFDAGSLTVGLESGIRPEGISTLVWHELCHAIDYQEVSSWKTAPDALGELAPLVLDCELRECEDADSRDSAHSRRVEAFATMCQMGPIAAMATQHDCGDAPAGLHEVMSLLASDVWAGVPEGATKGSPVQWSEREEYGAIIAVDVNPGTGPSGEWLIDVRLMTDGGFYLPRIIDPYTGAIADVDSFDRSPVHVSNDEMPLANEVTLVSAVGVEGALRGAVARIDPIGLNPVFRNVVEEGGAWRLQADGCIPGPAVYFELDGHLWYAHASEHTLEWYLLIL